MQYQFVRQKQTVHPTVPNSDTLVDASVFVYPNHIDHGSPIVLREDKLLHKNPRAGHLA